MAHVSLCNSTRRYKFDEVLVVPSNLKEIPRVNAHIGSLLELSKFPEKIKMKICLALDEAMTNAIEHGNLNGQPDVEVAYSINKDVCIINVLDYGGYIFNPEYFEKLAEVKDWGVGGRGIFLIKNLMDEVYFFFQPGVSTSVVLIKYSDGK